jgi:hypothetical protein
MELIARKPRQKPVCTHLRRPIWQHSATMQLPLHYSQQRIFLSPAPSSQYSQIDKSFFSCLCRSRRCRRLHDALFARFPCDPAGHYYGGWAGYDWFDFAWDMQGWINKLLVTRIYWKTFLNYKMGLTFTCTLCHYNWLCMTDFSLY